MNVPIPENSITINGTIYVLVDDEEPEECTRCALSAECDTQNLLCNLLDKAPQGKRFEAMDVKASPWKTVIAGSPVPDTDRPVVGYWICGPEPFVEIVTHDPESGEWQDLDTSGCEQHNMKEPDYWIDLPDNNEY